MKMKIHRSALLFLITTVHLPSFAQSLDVAPVIVAPANQPPDEPRLLDTVVVSGSLPAPKLWEATKGEKVLVIMGTVSPTPRSMEWDSTTVAGKIGRAQIVLGPPGVSVTADVGIVGGLMLYSSYKRTKQLPAGKSLRDVLSPKLYARWSEAKARYLPNDDDVESLRPVHAAQALFDAAVSQIGLTNDDRVDPAIQKLAKVKGIPYRKTWYSIVLKDPKKTMKQLSSAAVDDGTCMEQTLDRLQTDVRLLVTRANAWAEGDVARLREMPFNDQKKACIAAVAQNDAARSLGITDPEAAALDRWMKIASESLDTNNVVFAQIPLWRLEGPQGALESLRADGYQVTAPE